MLCEIDTAYESSAERIVDADRTLTRTETSKSQGSLYALRIQS